MSLKTFLFPTYYDESRAYSVLLLVVRVFFGLLSLPLFYFFILQPRAPVGHAFTHSPQSAQLAGKPASKAVPITV